MMMSTPFCRVCLSSDVKMHVIQHKHVDLYEKLANTKLNADYEGCRIICYVCSSLLRKCQRFSEQACRSERFLGDLLRPMDTPDTLKINHETLLDIQDPAAKPTLARSEVRCVSISSAGFDENITTAEDEHEVVYEASDCDAQENLLCLDSHRNFEDGEDIKNGQTEMIEIEILAEAHDSDKHDTNYDNIDHYPHNDRKMTIKEIKENRDYDKKELIQNNNIVTIDQVCVESGKVYICDICSKTFTKKRKIVRHLICHTKKWSCNDCGEVFTHSWKLRDHHIRAHAGKMYLCQFCSKSFYFKRELKEHTRIHTKEKPYICQFCGQAFRISKYLCRHIRKHTGVKPYRCDVCEQSFSQLTVLKRHQLIHTGEKPYPCDVCRMMFRQRSALNKHKQVHSDEKPYSCNACSKVFSMRSGLRAHTLIHTRDQTQCCELCGVNLSTKLSMKRHVRLYCKALNLKKCPVKTFSCEKCGSILSSASSLRRHKRGYCKAVKIQLVD